MRRATVFACIGATGLFVATSLGLRAPDDKTGSLTTEVLQADLPIEVELSGTFAAANKDEIRMEPKSYRGDLIVTKLVPEGRSVSEGEVLMEFDQSSLEDAQEEASDEVSSKEVAVEKARAELRSWEIDQERAAARQAVEQEKAHDELEKAKAEAALEFESQQRTVKDAENRLADAEIDFEQLTQLYEERELHTATENILIARQQRALEDSRRALDRAKRELQIWESYVRNREIKDKQLDYDDKVAEGEKTTIKAAAERKEKEEDVAKAERELTKAQEKVAELGEDAESLQVLAPRDGIVFYGTLESGGGYSDIIVFGGGGNNDEMKVGGRVRTFQTLMTVASMERLSVDMKALEGDIQHLQEGLPIVIRPDAFPALSIDGQLTKVDSVASRTALFSEIREFKVHGDYEGTYPQLRSGMNCRVTVRANSVPDCIQVPVLAVFSDGDTHYCLVDQDGRRVRRTVTIGTANESMVEIKDGLRVGERVALYDPSAG